MGQTPGLPATPVDTVVPEGSPVSYDDGVASSAYSQHSAPEENFGTMMTLTDLFIFLDPLRLGTLQMRELGQMLFLWETTLSELMRYFLQLLCLLLQTSNRRLVVLRVSILLVGGFVEHMES